MKEILVISRRLITKQNPDSEYLLIDELAKIVSQGIIFSTLHLNLIEFQENELSLLVYTLTLSKSIIKKIEFDSCDFSKCDVEKLANWLDSLEFLEEISMEECEFDKPLFPFLKQKTSATSSLKTICITCFQAISDHPFLGEYLGLLNSLADMQSLTTLIIGGPPLNDFTSDDKQGKVLADILINNPAIHTLTLDGLGINDEFIRELSIGLYQCKSLLELNLSCNKITDTGASIIARYLKEMHTVTKIYLASNQFVSAIEEFADIPQYNPMLSKIYFVNDTHLEVILSDEKVLKAMASKLHAALINNKNSMVDIDIINYLHGIVDPELLASIKTVFEKNKQALPTIQENAPPATKLANFLSAGNTISPPSLLSLVSRFFRIQPEALKYAPESVLNTCSKVHPPYIIGTIQNENREEDIQVSKKLKR